MGHDTHFLERLERLEGKHLEGAMSLYRDPEFVKMVLQEAKIPDGTDRIALSLNDIHYGPFVIVTRDGRFVTCLAEGMHTKETLVVPREKLDKLLARMEHYRDRMAKWNQMVALVGGSVKLWKKFLRGGYLVSREEFVAMSGTAPVVREELWNIVCETALQTLNIAELLLRADMVRKIEKPDDQIYNLAQNLWFATWKGSHCTVLASMDGNVPSRVAKLKNTEKDLGFLVGLVGAHIGMVPHILRGAWAAGRLGKPIFKQVKQGYLDATLFGYHVTAIAQLWAMGLRNPKLSEQVKRVLDRGNPFLEQMIREAPEGDKERVEKMLVPVTLQSLRNLQDNPQVRFKEEIWTHVRAIRDHFPRFDDIPDDVVATWNANQMFSIFAINEHWRFATGIPMALLSRSPPEHMYWEEKWLKLFSDPWKPEMVFKKMLLPWRRAIRSVPSTPTTEAKTARNEPCPCGSGKKYKKCCGK